MKERITDQKWFVYSLVPVCALMWGFSFFGTTVALEYVEPMQLLALRWTVAAVLFLVLAAFKVIKISYKGKNLKMVLAVGILQPCIYSIFETTGIKYTTTSESSIFIATIPLMVLLIGEMFLHRKNSMWTRLAIVMAFSGVIICVVFSPSFSLEARGLGYLLLMGAVISGALYSFVSSRAAAEFNAVEVTFTIAIMGSIFFNVLNFAMGYGFSGYAACFHDGRLMAGVLFLGIGCSCIAYLVFNYALAVLPTAIASNLIANSSTAVGVVSGCMFAGDPFGWYTVFGVAMTIGGVCLASLKGKSS